MLIASTAISYEVTDCPLERPHDQPSTVQGDFSERCRPLRRDVRWGRR